MINYSYIVALVFCCCCTYSRIYTFIATFVCWEIKWERRIQHFINLFNAFFYIVDTFSTRKFLYLFSFAFVSEWHSRRLKIWILNRCLLNISHFYYTSLCLFFDPCLLSIIRRVIKGNVHKINFSFFQWFFLFFHLLFVDFQWICICWA